MFIAAQSTVAQTGKRHDVHQQMSGEKHDMCICVCINNGILFSHKRMKYCHLQQHEWI